MARRTNITVRFGARVRDLRRQDGLSQEEFAARCGLDRTYMSGIEREKRNVALRNIEAIANAFNISLFDLFKGL
jgi:transcriptional regulator with XRE-family HTH domain